MIGDSTRMSPMWKHGAADFAQPVELVAQVALGRAQLVDQLVVRGDLDRPVVDFALVRLVVDEVLDVLADVGEVVAELAAPGCRRAATTRAR